MCWGHIAALRQMSGVFMARAAHFAFLVLTVASLAPVKALAQGETTSGIVAQVRDATNAVVPGAIVTMGFESYLRSHFFQYKDCNRFSQRRTIEGGGMDFPFAAAIHGRKC